MKRALIVWCVVTLVYTLLNAAIPPVESYPASGERLIAGLLFWPMLVSAGGLLLTGVLLVFSRGFRRLGSFALICSLPLVAQYFHLKSMDDAHALQSEWEATNNVLGNELLKYHTLFPERFHYTGADESVTVDGFGAWVREQGPAANPWPWLVRYRFKGDQLIDAWGNPFVFALDKNHDGFIDAFGYHRSVSGILPPFASGLRYTTAVAVDSAHDHSEYSFAYIAHK